MDSSLPSSSIASPSTSAVAAIPAGPSTSASPARRVVEWLDLAGPDWTVEGYIENEIRMPWHRPELSFPTPYTPRIPAVVPGSVHSDLLTAKMVPDWNVGTASCACEWVASRTWLYRRAIAVPQSWAGRRITLEADGLDHSGLVFVNDRYVGHFSGSLKRHRIDLTDHLLPGQTCELQIGFDVAPSIAGQRGYTSQIDAVKPRYGYIWDWCPRLINVGIWDRIALRASGNVRLGNVVVTSDLHANLRDGTVRVQGQILGTSSAELQVAVLTPDGTRCAEKRLAVSETFDATLTADSIRLWWPRTLGEQPIYRVVIEAIDTAGHISDAIDRPIGFRRVRWLANPDAPDDAIAYTCEINGRRIFMKGINWVPLKPFTGTVTHNDYLTRLQQYAAMHVNILRVWGGGPIETQTFYDLCDVMGLLVWQEFPLSSSLFDNWPPERTELVNELAAVAEDYIERRAHHPSLILWCGGNELQGGHNNEKAGEGRPVDLTHPCIARFDAIVKRLDPQRAFWPTSASGPWSWAKAENFGKHVHHDVHGPWEVPDRDQLTRYWNADDALLRSEVGVPGMTCLRNLVRCAGSHAIWPADPTNAFWLHRANHWLPSKPMTRDFGPWTGPAETMPATMVRCSQFAQADAYRYIIETCRRRAPRNSGVLLWMGHDMLHVPANNSVIEDDGSQKLAYYACMTAMAPLSINVRFAAMTFDADTPIVGEIFLIDDHTAETVPGQYTLSITNLHGQTLYGNSGTSRSTADTAAQIASFKVDAPDIGTDVLLVRCEWTSRHRSARNDYILTRRSHAPLSPLRTLPTTSLATSIQRDTLTLTNTGTVAAIGVWPVSPTIVPVRSAWPMAIAAGESIDVALDPAAPIDTIELDGLNLVSRR